MQLHTFHRPAFIAADLADLVDIYVASQSVFSLTSDKIGVFAASRL